MYNSGRRGKRASDGYGIISQADKFYQTEYSIPVVTSFAVTDGSYVPLDDTAVDTAGGQTIVLYGSGFAPGATVTVGGVTIGAVTYLDQGRLTFTAPAKSSGSYTVVVINSNGGAGILVPGLVYSGVPVWSTSAGSVGSVYETTSVSSTFVATGDAPMTYSVLSGSLPPGTTLSPTGVLSGSAPIESGSTTYSFTIRATDGQLQDTDRSFSLTVNTDLVTFSSPTNNQVITSYEYKPISNVTVAATSAAGYGVVYSSNTRPTGITLNATTGVISGTANTVGNTYTRLTATSNTTSRTATRDVVFNVNQDVVTWNTPADNYTISAYEYSAISNVTANATSAAGFGVLYSANTTPTGITLDANTGLISGTPTTVGNTYSLLTATANTTTRSNTRNIIYNVNQDVVTWSSPADGTSYSLQGGSAIANVTLAATSAAGKSITYTANALPSGLGISGNVIYGTPDTAQTVTTLLTATAATTNRTATRTISWSISLGDIYWKNTSLLLNANTPTPTFINDASLNNNQLSIFGDTKPNNFNPYQQRYYSNYFDGTGDYLTVPNSSNFAFGTGDFTIEFWINTTDTGGGLISQAVASGWAITIFGNTIYWQSSYNSTNLWTYSAATITNNLWHHLAFSRISGSTKFFIDGILVATNADTTNYTATGGSITIGRDANPADLIGYISNLRIIKGTGLYTSTFTPSTTPLTAIASTVLLTCQSNRLIDNSVNNFTITKNGDTTVSSAHPFTTPTTAAYNTGYSAIFDGTDDYLTVATSSNMSLTGDFTVEFWIYNSSASWGSYSMVGIVGANKSRIYTDSSSILHLYNGAAGTLNWYTGVSDLALNTWHHFAFSRVGSTLKFYTNGTSRTMTTASGSVTETIDFNGTMFIGGTSAASVMSAGRISNLRVIKGTGLYSANFTPPTSALTAVANTQLLTCQDSTFKDNSTNAYVITSYNQAQPIALSPFTMTTSNTTITSLGSAYFDGTGDYVKPTTSPGFSFGTGDFTIECWVWLDAAAGANASLFTTCPAATYNGVVMGRDVIGISGPGGTGGNLVGVTIAVNTWTHVALTRAGTSMKVFLNGVLAGSATNSTDVNSTLATIGSRYVEATGYLWTGYISDLRVVKGTALYTSNFLPPQAPLTAVANTQLLTLQYNGGATNNGFVDQSSFNNIITRNGNVNQGTFSPYSQNGWSNYFNGSSDYLTLPSSSTAYNFGAGVDFTIEAWVYPTVLAGNSWGIIDARVSGATSAAWILHLVPSAGTYRLEFFNAGANDGTTSIPLNTWTHVAVSRVGTNLRFYVNGTLDTTLTNYGGSISPGTTAPRVGTTKDASGTSYATTGYISNLRIVNGTGLYSSNFTPSTTPLTPITNTSLLTCQSNRFIDNSVNNFTLTTTGTPSVQAFSPFGGLTSVPTSYSVYFNGSTDYLTVPNSTALQMGSGDFTIEYWIYYNSIASYQTPFSKGYTAAGDILFQTGNGDGKVIVYLSGSAVITEASGASVGQWYHYALVRSGTTVTLYRNGVSVGTTTSSVNFNTTDQLGVGATGKAPQGGSVGQYGISGYISNFRMVKGTAVYTGAFTPPTSPLTAIANTSVLVCQSNILIDNSSNYSTVSAGGTPKPLAFNPFGLTNTTQVSYSPSVNGGSMYFDGTGDYLVAPAAANISGTGYSWTIQGWFYQTSVGAFTKVILDSWNGGQTAFLIRNNSNYLDFYITGGSNIQTATAVIKANTWYHFAVVKDINNSNTITMYLNGIKQGTSLLNNTTSVNTGTFGIGGATNGGAEVFPGYISDVQIIKGVALYTSNFYPPVSPLTPTTTIGTTTYSSVFLLNGTSGGIIDYHGTNNLETVGDVKLAPEDPYSGSYYSNYSDGNGDYLTVPSAAWTTLTGTFTVEYWIKWDVAPAAGSITGVYASGGWSLYNDGTRITPNLYGTGNIFNSTFLISSIVSGKWYHLAVTRDSSNLMTMWVNGVSVGSTTTATSYTQGTWYIFSFNNVNAIQGNISNFRVTNTCLYTTTFTPSTTPLTAVSGTQLLTCQSNRFVDNSTNNATLTATGTVAVKSINPFQQNTGKSLYFDGTGDYMVSGPSSSYSMGTGNFTVECWIYSISNTAGSGNGIFDFNTSAAFGSSFSLVLISNQLYDAATGLQGSTTIVNGTWNHVAMVRSSGTQKTYLNGVQQTTGTVNTNQTQTYLLVGGYYTTSNLFNGYIKDLRITKGIARYTATFTPPTSTFKTS